MQNTEHSADYSELPLPVEPAIIPGPPSPNNPPWGSLEGVGLWVASILCILILPTLFLLPYLATRNPPVTESEQIVELAKSDPTAIFIQIIAILPAHLLTILLAWLIVTKRRQYSFKEMLGWQTGGFRWWHYLIVLGSFFVLAAVVGSLVPEQENDLIRMLQSSRYVVYVVAFVATFTAPIVEEVVYRGVLYSAFQRALGVPAAFALVTFLFAIIHVPQYWPSYSTIFLLGVLSVVLTAIRVKTNNLWPCIVLHTLFNGIQSVFLIAEPLLPKPEVQQQAATILYFLK
ncbi:MAG: type II CAAX endopeptidase family protein [Pyrinomonadaceae bacterium]